MRLVLPLITLFLISFCPGAKAQKTLRTEVLVVGGGTGGTAAGIQSARMGRATLIVETGPWLGGMISAAGVSAIDGNHKLPSGLWAEFRNRLYQVYGGPAAVETGWVSNTQFEPHVADSIFKSMAGAEQKLSVLYQYHFHSLSLLNGKINTVVFRHATNGSSVTVFPRVVIDATELGDVMKKAGVPYSLGMEAGSRTGETVGVTESNDIVQDLTYVAILKDYGKGADKTIARPANYDPTEFDAACTDYYLDKSRKAPSVDAQKMLDYGKLPGGKYMLNWPIYGNDTYLNIVEMDDAARQRALVAAKEQTYRFIYFIQHQLGFKQLGLADDEFPTADKLALMPYHREGRRVEGLVRFTMRHIAEPFTYGSPLYRTGVSVGDYPIDHHHKKNPKAPQHLEFYPIPSFNVPLGALIPKKISNLIIAEKGISVSNVANGTTRLQPCVLLTGQAAGTLAALSVSSNRTPGGVPVRAVQQALLRSKAYIMPYIDVQPEDPRFEAIQKLGATGILRGKGIPYKWANQTWFYPDTTVATIDFISTLNDFKKTGFTSKTTSLTIEEAIEAVHQLAHAYKVQLQSNRKASTFLKSKSIEQYVKKNWMIWGLENFDSSRPITRAELAVLFNKTIDPFNLQRIDHNGKAY